MLNIHNRNNRAAMTIFDTLILIVAGIAFSMCVSVSRWYCRRPSRHIFSHHVAVFVDVVGVVVVLVAGGVPLRVFVYCWYYCCCSTPTSTTTSWIPRVATSTTTTCIQALRVSLLPPRFLILLLVVVLLLLLLLLLLLFLLLPITTTTTTATTTITTATIYRLPPLPPTPYF